MKVTKKKFTILEIQREIWNIKNSIQQYWKKNMISFAHLKKGSSSYIWLIKLDINQKADEFNFMHYMYEKWIAWCKK